MTERHEGGGRCSRLPLAAPAAGAGLDPATRHIRSTSALPRPTRDPDRPAHAGETATGTADL